MAIKGIWIPSEILRNDNLNQSQKFILSEISQLETLENGCFASNLHFSNLIGITKENVSRNIKLLEEKGYIRVKIEKGSRNHTRIITLTTLVRPPYQSSKTPLSKRQETIDNNTTNNTYSTPFEKFTSELEEIFEGEKIATHKSKINKTNEVKKYFDKIKDTHDLDKIKKDFALYVKLNQNTASRLSKYLMAVYEGNISGLPYSDKKNKPDSGQWESVDM